jgi:hypothetical protein
MAKLLCLLGIALTLSGCFYKGHKTIRKRFITENGIIIYYTDTLIIHNMDNE